MNRNNISSYKLAESTNIPASTIKNIMQDVVKNVTLDNAYKLAKHFNYSLEDLITIDLSKEV